MNDALKITLVILNLITFCFGQKVTTGSEDKNVKENQTSQEIKSNKAKTKEEKWEDFFRKFKEAFAAKDKAQIVALTSQVFFDGGGGATITEWLDSTAFVNSQNFNHYKKILNNGVKNFKNPDTGDIYKATGKSEYLDLYFEYKGGKWFFGGVVGD